MLKTRAEIALRFQTASCNRRAADFVLSTLLDTDYPYFPTVKADCGDPLFVLRAAELAVIEVQITEQMWARWTLIHPTIDSAHKAATDHLWTRLSQIREKARMWIGDQEHHPRSQPLLQAQERVLADPSLAPPISVVAAARPAPALRERLRSRPRHDVLILGANRQSNAG